MIKMMWTLILAVLLSSNLHDRTVAAAAPQDFYKDICVDKCTVNQTKSAIGNLAGCDECGCPDKPPVDPGFGTFLIQIASETNRPRVYACNMDRRGCELGRNAKLTKNCIFFKDMKMPCRRPAVYKLVRERTDYHLGPNRADIISLKPLWIAGDETVSENSPYPPANTSTWISLILILSKKDAKPAGQCPADVETLDCLITSDKDRLNTMIVFAEHWSKIKSLDFKCFNPCFTKAPNVCGY